MWQIKMYSEFDILDSIYFPRFECEPNFEEIRSPKIHTITLTQLCSVPLKIRSPQLTTVSTDWVRDEIMVTLTKKKHSPSKEWAAKTGERRGQRDGKVFLTQRISTKGQRAVPILIDLLEHGGNVISSGYWVSVRASALVCAKLHLGIAEVTPKCQVKKPHTHTMESVLCFFFFFNSRLPVWGADRTVKRELNKGQTQPGMRPKTTKGALYLSYWHLSAELALTEHWCALKKVLGSHAGPCPLEVIPFTQEMS